MKFKEDSRPLVNAYTRVELIFTKKTCETKTTLKQKFSFYVLFDVVYHSLQT